MGPHSQVQNVAETTTEKGDRPVLRPYNSGSITWPMIASVARYRPAVQSTIDQPGLTAAASASGRTAAKGAPIYGTKRSSRPTHTPQQRGRHADHEEADADDKAKRRIDPSWIRK